MRKCPEVESREKFVISLACAKELVLAGVKLSGKPDRDELDRVHVSPDLT